MYLISSKVLLIPKEILIDPNAVCSSIPLAKSTWEGSVEAVEQALPLLAIICLKSRAIRIGSPCIFGIEKLIIFGRDSSIPVWKTISWKKIKT